MAAWSALQAGQTNPLVDLVSSDPEILRYLYKKDLARLMDASRHLGDAPQRARALADEISARLSKDKA
jgi:adenylosuccinate lyase